MRSGFALAALAMLACHHGAPETPKPAPTPDAGPPDAIDVPDAGPPDAAPPPITFAPTPWPVGQVVKIWRRTTLTDLHGGSSTIEDKYELSLTVQSNGAGITAVAGDDCKVLIAGGTAKVSGDCGGRAPDVGYKLDLIAQLLSIAHGTVHVGDQCGGLARPLTALFRLQETGAMMTAHLARTDETGAIYAIHADLDGNMLRPGLHVTAALDGEIHLDAHGTGMTGTLTAPKVTIQGYPMADYTSKGKLEMAFGIEPQP